MISELDQSAVPEGVTPLVWGETTDPRGNSLFEALTHIEPTPGVMPSEYWQVAPSLEENRVFWRVSHTDAIGLPEEGFALVKEGRFDSADDAKAACEHMEIQLGGAALAPRTPLADPDQAPPFTTDEHGFAPTRTIRSRWSRNDGTLYLFRVWAKVDKGAETTIEKRLEGEEFEAALPAFITQQMVQGLVANITQRGGWLVPLTWETGALGKVRMECEVHFVAVRRLLWAKTPLPSVSLRNEQWNELPAPSHALICSIVGETLSRRKAEMDQALGATTEEELQRQIAKNARALGIPSPMPEAAHEEGGNVLPITLEHMQKEGMGLNGKRLR